MSDSSDAEAKIRLIDEDNNSELEQIAQLQLVGEENDNVAFEPKFNKRFLNLKVNVKREDHSFLDDDLFKLNQNVHDNINEVVEFNIH